MRETPYRGTFLSTSEQPEYPPPEVMALRLCKNEDYLVFFWYSDPTLARGIPLGKSLPIVRGGTFKAPLLDKERGWGEVVKNLITIG